LPTQKLEEEKIEDILRASSIYRGDMIFHPIQLIHLPLIFYFCSSDTGLQISDIGLRTSDTRLPYFLLINLRSGA
jgi:hypothetical protein